MSDNDQIKLDEIKTSLSIADELQRDDCDWLIEQLTAVNQALAESQQREAGLRDNAFELLNFIRFLESSKILTGTMREGRRIMSLKVRADELVRATMDAIGSTSPTTSLVPWEVCQTVIDELTNLQPHIAQLPKASQSFIDSHIDVAIAHLNYYSPQQKENNQ